MTMGLHDCGRDCTADCGRCKGCASCAGAIDVHCEHQWCRCSDCHERADA